MRLWLFFTFECKQFENSVVGFFILSTKSKRIFHFNIGDWTGGGPSKTTLLHGVCNACAKRLLSWQKYTVPNGWCKTSKFDGWLHLDEHRFRKKALNTQKVLTTCPFSIAIIRIRNVSLCFRSMCHFCQRFWSEVHWLSLIVKKAF